MTKIKENKEVAFAPENQNQLDVFINQEALLHSIENRETIDAVSYGYDTDSDFENDIFISVTCHLEHDDCPCFCQDLLNQDLIRDYPIDLKTAELMSYYIAGLLGGKPVCKG